MTQPLGESNRITCPACGTQERMPKTCEATTTEGSIAFYACQDCHAWICHPFEIPDYASGSDAPGFALYRPEFYSEMGCGLAFVTQAMNAILSSGVLGLRPRMIEVGGGLGFAIHFAALQHGVRALGYEPGPLAILGAEALGVDFRRIGFESVPGQEVEFIQAIEVLEHVPDPFEFVDSLYRSLTPGGIAVLTTPDREVLEMHLHGQIAGSDQDAVAILSPGQHRMLFHRDSLNRLLHRVGARQTRITTIGKSLVCLFTPSPSIDLAVFELDPQGAVLRPYLQAALADVATRPKASLSPHLRHGFLYQLFREAFHAGDFAGAVECYLSWCEAFGGPGSFLDALNDFSRQHPLDQLSPAAHFRALSGFTYTAYPMVFFMSTLACIAPQVCPVPLNFLVPACSMTLRRLSHLLQVQERMDPPSPRSVLQSYLIEYEAYYLRFRYHLAILLVRTGQAEAAILAIGELLADIHLTRGRLFCDARLESEVKALQGQLSERAGQ